MKRLVIYQTPDGLWNGAGEFVQGRWPFKQTKHAPVTHAATAEAVFSWLMVRYPGREISYVPSLLERYSK